MTDLQKGVDGWGTNGRRVNEIKKAEFSLDYFAQSADWGNASGMD